MKLKILLLLSQEHATCPYHEPAQSSRSPPRLFLEDPS
jgi:hypothetical protein